MNYQEVAAKVLAAIGGKGNVDGVTTCLTRLRLSLVDTSQVDSNALHEIRGVLGTASRGANGLEVVFGPAAIEGVAREFAIQSNTALSEADGACANPLVAIGENKDEVEAADGEPEQGRGGIADRVVITPGRRSSYRAQQQAALDNERLDGDDLDALRAFLGDTGKKSESAKTTKANKDKGRSVLVINGPNINMLGVREPGIYGKEDYAALIRTCKAAAAEAGFANVKCYQSNHEGSIVDEIQAALGAFDGIVMNPGAYTHTSIAILDAVKAVSLPCVEVHISRVEDREEFRQVSYVRQACFETITGMGIEGYRKAILDLAAHLGM